MKIIILIFSVRCQSPFSDNIYINVNLKFINIHKSDLILVKKRIENIVWIKSVEII